MTKLFRYNRTGDYYTSDKRFQIERGTSGWNVNEFDPRFETYRYSFSCDTLKEVRVKQSVFPRCRGFDYRL